MNKTCSADEVKSLPAEKIRELLDNDRKGEYLILDVRQPEEYRIRHVPGALLIPLGELEKRYYELDRSKKIIAYCRSGHRSLAAAVTLCGLGFSDVSHLEGGILKWPYETVAGIPERKLAAEGASMREILMLAIKLEKGAHDFYLLAQQRTPSPEAREVFQRLAGIEKQHMERLYRRASGEPGRERIPPLDELSKKFPETYMEGGLEIDASLEKVRKDVDEEMEILELGVEKEFLSYDFYKRAAALVYDSDAKALLHELAVEERGHADSLLRRVIEIIP